MPQIFNEMIANRFIEDTCLMLPSEGANKPTIFWQGNILKNDWIAVPGLAGCMGIICISTMPTKQSLGKSPVDQPVASMRSSVHKQTVRQISGQSRKISQNISDPLQQGVLQNDQDFITAFNSGSIREVNKRLSRKSAFVEEHEVYKVYALHAMGDGHFLAKNRMEMIFKKHPDKDSLKILFYCTTNHGQIEWLKEQRGERNVSHNLNGYDRESTDPSMRATLYGSPQKKDGSVITRGVYAYYDLKTRLPSEIARLKINIHELGEADGVDESNDTDFALLDGSDIRQDWGYLKKHYVHHLHNKREAEWHKKDFCEICNKKVGSRFKAMFTSNMLARHHCRGCGRTVCKDCCQKASKLNVSQIKYISDDPTLTSYVCIKCNDKNWDDQWKL